MDISFPFFLGFSGLDRGDSGVDVVNCFSLINPLGFLVIFSVSNNVGVAVVGWAS